MIMMQLVIAALIACLPSTFVFAFVLRRAKFARTEVAGVIAMIALIYAGAAWLVAFICLAVALVVTG